MTTLNYKATCFHCKRGENNVPATHFVTGHNGNAPFKGYVCDEHLDMIGHDLKIIQVIDVDYLVRFHTGFENFEDMVNASNHSYTPTLRTDITPELRIVRRAYNDRMIELGLPNRI